LRAMGGGTDALAADTTESGAATDWAAGLAATGTDGVTGAAVSDFNSGLASPLALLVTSNLAGCAAGTPETCEVGFSSVCLRHM
jgi:hypothetical protein